MARRRVGRMVGASWVLATVVTGLVVWRAVAVLDDGTRTDVLSGAQVSGLLQSAASASVNASTSSVTIPAAPSESTPTSSPTAPAATAAATTTAPKTALPSTKPPAVTPTPVVRTWTVTGGVASVSCTGQVISLLSASPQDGWRVKIEDRGPDRVKLEFVMAEREVKLIATCVGGVPSQTTTEQND